MTTESDAEKSAAYAAARATLSHVRDEADKHGVAIHDVLLAIRDLNDHLLSLNVKVSARDRAVAAAILKAD